VIVIAEKHRCRARVMNAGCRTASRSARACCSQDLQLLTASGGRWECLLRNLTTRSACITAPVRPPAHFPHLASGVDEGLSGERALLVAHIPRLYMAPAPDTPRSRVRTSARPPRYASDSAPPSKRRKYIPGGSGGGGRASLSYSQFTVSRAD
jgi:hypothetical protein